MNSYRPIDDHELFLYDPKRYYQKSHWLDITIKQLKQLADVSGVALYIFDFWRDKYVHIQSSGEECIGLPEYLPTSILKDINQYKRLGSKVTEKLIGNKVYQDMFMMSLVDENETIGYVIFLVEDEKVLSKNKQNKIIQLVKDTTGIFIELRQARISITQANKYEMMYNITQKLHSSMNSKDVLTEIIDAIYLVYPNFKSQLFLTKNYQDDFTLPVKEFIYNDKYADKLSTQAFLTGEIKIEKKNDSVNIYAPLNGKQGIYGVLELKSSDILQIPTDDVEFIRLLANTAGNALENAQLYQQSNVLVWELKLINTFTHELNKLSSLTSLTSFIKGQFISSFNSAEIGLFLLGESNKPKIQQDSTEPFHRKEYTKEINLLLEEVMEKKEAVFITDLAKSHDGIELPYRSIILFPMIQTDQIIGIFMVMHKDSYYFTFDQFKLMKSLAQHSTLAFDNIILREKLEESVITDYLTKLYSREYLDVKCREHLSNDQQGVFLLVDVDDFKEINDSFGHDIGDAVLIQVANVILRKIEGKGFAARWGGEELAIYLPEANDKMACIFAKELLATIEHSTKPNVTCSIGIAKWDHKKRVSLSKLFNQADRALYKAKSSGKNQYQYNS